MTWYAATRLTLTKSEAETKPVIEKDEPFPTLAAYPETEMKRLEAEGLVYQAPKNADPVTKAERAAKVLEEADPTAGTAGDATT